VVFSLAKKAQMFTVDVLVAAGIFIIILIAAIYSWDYSREKVYLTDKRNYMETVSMTAFSSLIETSGNPSDWYIDQGSFNTTSVRSLGLARDRPWQLSQDKIEAFRDWYSEHDETFRRLLGLQGLNLHMRFWAYDANFSSSADFVIGASPTPNVRNLVKLERLALLSNGTGDYWLRIEMDVWEDE
jgi:hypothetical protein